MLATVIKKQPSIYSLAIRCLSAQAVTPPEGDAIPTGPPKVGDTSNVFKGQHIRYIPTKRLHFDFISPEGPLALLFESSDHLSKRAQNWKISTAVAIPAATLAYYTLGAAYWWAYPMLFLSSLVHLYDRARLEFLVYKTEGKRLWLFQNGDQILMETYDGQLHRMNIKDNTEHEIVEQKNHLVFVIENSGRTYLMSNLDCKKLDYNLVDRIMKGISIDTTKFQSLYNRLIYRQ